MLAGLELVLRIRFGTQPGRIAMSDWSTYAAGRVREKIGDENVRDRRALQEEEILKLNSFRRWEELRDLLIQRCTEFNAEPGMHGRLAWNNDNPNALKIEDTQTKVSLHTAFDPERHEVSVGGSLGKTYRITVIQGTRETCLTDGSLTASAHEIAREVLEGLLAIN
jgi:hypothetical protein